jgi:hypothetical protein
MATDPTDLAEARELAKRLRLWPHQGTDDFSVHSIQLVMQRAADLLDRITTPDSGGDLREKVAEEVDLLRQVERAFLTDAQPKSIVGDDVIYHLDGQTLGATLARVRRRISVLATPAPQPIAAPEAGEATIGPRPGTLVCKRCPAYEAEKWREPSGDGETWDTGQYAWCNAAERKSMGAYHYDHSATPDWCPAPAQSTISALREEVERLKVELDMAFRDPDVEDAIDRAETAEARCAKMEAALALALPIVECEIESMLSSYTNDSKVESIEERWAYSHTVAAIAARDAARAALSQEQTA